MRVLMTADTVGGVWTYALELVHALAPHGVTFHLATMGRRLTAEQGAAAAREPNLEVHESAFKLEWMDNPWDDVVAAGDWLIDLEARLAPDLVHLNGYSHGALPWRAPVVAVAHSCVLSWWDAVKGEAAPESWDRYRSAVFLGLHSADAVAAPSATMLAAVERHYGALRDGAVVHNARRKGLFAPRPKEPFVLAAGRIWDEAKNVRALDAVAEDLPWPVRVAGETCNDDGRGAAHRRVQGLGILSSQALADTMGRAALYALPARYEPFGLSVLEAAMSGCALVLGDIASLRELWDDAAVYVKPDDPSALRQALFDLMTDADRRLLMARRALDRARHYTPERMARGYLDLYGRVLAKRTASPAPALPITDGDPPPEGWYNLPVES